MDKPPDDQAEFMALFRELVASLEPRRQGWKHSHFDETQLAYILDREAVIEMIRRVIKIDLRSIVLDDQELSYKIQSNVLHALHVMLAQMRLTEDKII